MRAVFRTPAHRWYHPSGMVLGPPVGVNSVKPGRDRSALWIMSFGRGAAWLIVDVEMWRHAALLESERGPRRYTAGSSDSGARLAKILGGSPAPRCYCVPVPDSRCVSGID